MALARVSTAFLYGWKVQPAVIEVDIQPGLPYFSVIGLPDKRIEEARERVRSAIKNSGLAFPLGKITVNLTPASLHKTGTGYDVGIALGILAASGSVSVPESAWVVGELSLDGSILPTKGMFSILVEGGKHSCIVPSTAADMAARAGTRIIHAGTLVELIDMLRRRVKPSVPVGVALERVQATPEVYLIDSVRGQVTAKRCLEIALAGGHNLYFTGPPGTGKSMLAQAAAQLLPPLEGSDLFEVARLHDAGGRLYDIQAARPPYSAPHHKLTERALIGGGAPVGPGELSLAHRGVLFLDEFPEIQRSVKDSLREPLQDKQVRLHRRGDRYVFPADCIVLAAQNPCPCGLRGSRGNECRCDGRDLQRYASAVSEALYDRFDLFGCLKDSSSVVESSYLPGVEMARRIGEARNIQQRRNPRGVLNGSLPPDELNSIVSLDEEMKKCIEKAGETLYLSQRGVHKVLAVSRTIADLEGVEEPTIQHIHEALQYRRREG